LQRLVEEDAEGRQPPHRGYFRLLSEASSQFPPNLIESHPISSNLIRYLDRQDEISRCSILLDLARSRLISPDLTSLIKSSPNRHRAHQEPQSRPPGAEHKHRTATPSQALLCAMTKTGESQAKY